MSGIHKAAVLEALGMAEVLLAQLKVRFPAVAGANTIMEELVRFLPWHLEADKILSGNNRLSAFAAMDDGSLFHASALCFVFLMGRLFLDRF